MRNDIGHCGICGAIVTEGWFGIDLFGNKEYTTMCEGNPAHIDDEVILFGQHLDVPDEVYDYVGDAETDYAEGI